jgi:hypothetical protein
MLSRHWRVSPDSALRLERGAPVVLEVPTDGTVTVETLIRDLEIAETIGGVEGVIVRPRSGLRGNVDLRGFGALRRLVIQDLELGLENFALCPRITALDELEARAGRVWPEAYSRVSVATGICSGGFGSIAVQSSGWFRIARCRRLERIAGRYDWLGVEKCSRVRWDLFSGTVRHLELRGATPLEWVAQLARGDVGRSLSSLTLAAVRGLSSLDPGVLAGCAQLREIALDADDRVVRRWRDALTGTPAVVTGRYGR